MERIQRRDGRVRAWLAHLGDALRTRGSALVQRRLVRDPGSGGHAHSGAGRRGANRVAVLAILSMGMAATTSGAGDARYLYDEGGRLIETVAADGTSVHYRYDAVGNITSVLHKSVAAVAISGFVPSSGAAGSVVSVFGSGFNLTPASNVVKFNGVAATVVAASANSLRVTVPSGATTGPISIANGAASATSVDQFKVATLGVPTFTGISPKIGPQGTWVTLTGTNFQPVKENNKVLFGSIAAKIASASSTTLITGVPSPASSGKISITTPYGVVTSASDFFAVPPAYSVANVQFTGRLTLGGANLTVTIPGAAKTGLILFDGVVGQAGFRLVTTGGTLGGGNIAVFSPDGSRIASGAVTEGGTIVLPTLPVSGTYTIAVESGTSGGSVTLTTGQADLAMGPLSIGTIIANRDGSWTIPFSFTVTNPGTVPVRPIWYDRGYLSTNAVLDKDDQGLWYAQIDGVLAPGQSYTVSSSVTTTTSTAPGSYTFIVKADGHESSSGGTNMDNGGIPEASEINNTASATVTLSRPDLAASALTLGTVVANQNGSWTIPVSFKVTNAGTVAAQPVWYDVGYLSADAVLDAGDQSPWTLAQRSGPLAPGDSYMVSTTFTTTTTTTPGNYTFFVKTDGHNSVTGGTITDDGGVVETSKANNMLSASVSLSRPDLVASALTLGTVVANQNGSWTIPVSFKVTNAGPVAAQPVWYDVGYLSADGVLDAGDQSPWILGQRSGALAPGDSYMVSSTFTTTTATSPGNYTFFVKTDGHNSVTGGTITDNGGIVETSKTNNMLSASVSLNRPDLAASALTIGTIVANSNGSWTIPVSFKVTNVGTVAAQPIWYDVGYLSADGVLDAGDQSPLPLGQYSAVLAPGGSYTVSATFTTTTTTAPGNYTFFVKTDGHNSVTGGTITDNGGLVEASKANNKLSTAITLQ